ncbi:MAG: tetratricopeptide repeat protein [Acidobacteriota bacterium]|nr:tetratricopeptide repeat protein [Acidobacteriota bacterium]
MTPGSPTRLPAGVPASRHDRLRWLLTVFGAALALRLLHVWQIHAAPFFDLKLGDAQAYDLWARQIVGGNWIGTGVFYQAPLYPYFLALVYGTLGSSVLTVRLVQAVISAASCVLLADTGWRLFSRRTGIAAGLLLAAYPPAIFLDTLVQKSALDLFFLCLALWLLGRLMEAPRRAWAWWLGVSLGCLMLTRENAAIMVPVVLVWIGVQRSLASAVRLRLAGLLVAGLAVVLLPVGVRNYAVGGEFYVTTSQFGPNFYIGNNPSADGTYKSLRPRRGKASFERQDATAMAEQAMGRTLTPAEVSGYFTGRALAFIRSEPGAWLRLLGRKFVLTWNSTEISDTEDQYTYAQWSWPLKLGSIWNLGVLAPLGILGIWITAGAWRRLWVLYALLAAYVASLILFYVFARYRFPMVPFLVLFAAAGLADLRQFWRTQRRQAVAGCAAVTVATAVFCNLPIVPRNRLEAVSAYNYGVGFGEQGDMPTAIGYYQTAVALDPGLAVAHNALGLAYGQQGDLARAAAQLTAAVQLDPSFARAQNNLGVVLGQQGHLAEALLHFREAVRLDPEYAEAHNNLGQMLAARGQADEAVREYTLAADFDPSYAEPLLNLARLRAQQGRLDEAIAADRKAIDRQPDAPAPHVALAQLLVRTGQLNEAISQYERAVTLKPDDTSIRNDFGILLAEAGRLDAAAEQFQRAIQLAPDRASTHNNLGIVLARQGQLAAAAAEFRRALAINPSYTEAAHNLERIGGKP